MKEEEVSNNESKIGLTTSNIFKLNNDISKISIKSNKSIDTSHILNINKNFNKSKEEIKFSKLSIIIGSNNIINENKIEYFDFINNQIFKLKFKIQGDNPNLYRLKNHLIILTFDKSRKNEIIISKLDFKNIINNKNTIFETNKIINNDLSYEFSSVQINNKIFIAGGIFKNKITNRFIIFNILDKKITKLASMKNSRYKLLIIHSAKTNYIYAIGGVDGKNNLVTNTCEKYNPLEQSWSKISSMNLNRKGHNSILIKDNIYVFGGNNGNENLNSIEFYNEYNDIWTLIDITLSIPRANFGIIYDNDNNYIYILGGILDNGESTSCIEKLNLDNYKEIINNSSIINFKSLLTIL